VDRPPAPDDRRGRGGAGGERDLPPEKHFGSTLNLHVHFHLLGLDGLYVPGGSPEAPPRFVRAPEPTPEEVRGLCERVARRARALVSRRCAPDPEEEREAPVLKLVGAEPREPQPPRLHARVDGFDIHASTAFEAHERAAVERFCRYAMRGPLASGRLGQGPRGTLVYRLKAPRPDGTTELLLTPMALLERLARLIPARGRHMIRYHGVLAPAAEWRPQVIPKPPEPAGKLLLRRRGARWIDWASLLKRVFLTNVLACACGGTRRIVAAIEEGPAARKILRHLGLPDELPRLEAARLRPQRELFETGPPAEDACDPLPETEFDQRSPHECAASRFRDDFAA
jgi:hypothetical protein